jgi:hypothetical protein
MLEPKWHSTHGPATFRATGIHPQTSPGGVFSPYLHRQTRIRNEVTLHVLFGRGRSPGAGASRMACGEGSSQKPRPFCNGRDMPTDSRLSGM